MTTVHPHLVDEHDLVSRAIVQIDRLLDAAERTRLDDLDYEEARVRVRSARDDLPEPVHTRLNRAQDCIDEAEAATTIADTVRHLRAAHDYLTAAD